VGIAAEIKIFANVIASFQRVGQAAGCYRAKPLVPRFDNKYSERQKNRPLMWLAHRHLP